MRKSFIPEVRNRFKALMELDETEDNANDGVNNNWENIVTVTAIAARHVWATGRRNGCHLIPGRQLKVDKG